MPFLQTQDISSTLTSSEAGNDENLEAWFWVLCAFYLCLTVVAAIGNGLVIYASYGTRNTSRLRYLDNLIKSLAVTDLLFALIGTPCLIFEYYIST